MRAFLFLTLILMSTTSFASTKVIGSLECSIVKSMTILANQKLPILETTGIAFPTLTISSATGYTCEASGSIGAAPDGFIIAGLNRIALTLPSGEKVQTEMGLPANPLRGLGLGHKSGASCSCLVTVESETSSPLNN